jgi:hypothetical protein
VTPGPGSLNISYPSCGEYAAGFDACSGCSVDSYTNYNVTFKCADLSQICSQTDGRRRLSSNGRGLQSLTGDDDVGSTTAVGDTQISQYSSVITALPSEIAVTLTANPFTMNIYQIRLFVGFGGSLLLMVILGAIYFHRWDVTDHNVILYNKKKLQPSSSRVKDEYEKEEKEEKEERKENKQDISDGEDSTILPTTFRPRQDSLNSNFSEASEISDQGEDLGQSVSAMAKSRSLRLKSGIFGKSNKLRETKDLITLLSGAHLDPLIGTGDVDGGRKRKDAQALGVALVSFMDHVIPPDLRERSASWRNIFKDIFLYHDFLCLFAQPSLSNTRLLRWVGFTLQLLVTLFLDSLLIGLAYPDTGQCEAYTTEEQCVTAAQISVRMHLHIPRIS